MIASRVALGVALAALVLLAGCGQKGPLYRPADEQAAEQYDPVDAYREERQTQPQPPQAAGSADSADDGAGATTDGNDANVTPRGAGE